MKDIEKLEPAKISDHYDIDRQGDEFKLLESRVICCSHIRHEVKKREKNAVNNPTKIKGWTTVSIPRMILKVLDIGHF